MNPDRLSENCAFCKYVLLAADSDMPNESILQDRAELAEVANKNESDAAAAERAYVRSLVKR